MSGGSSVPSGPWHKQLALGVERIGLISLAFPRAIGLVLLVLMGLAAAGAHRLKVDDSLSQLFRSDTPEFKQFEEVTRRFPSSEYDVLIVVEGKNLLSRANLEKLRDLVTDVQLVDGTRGIISRDDAAGAVHQLNVGDEIAQLFEIGARQQVLAFDDDQHVVLARREAPRHLLELLELRRVGAEQLAQRIIDLEAMGAGRRQPHQDQQDEPDGARKRERDQPDAFHTERKLFMPGPRRDGRSAGHGLILSELCRRAGPASNRANRGALGANRLKGGGSTHNYFHSAPQPRNITLSRRNPP